MMCMCEHFPVFLLLLLLLENRITFCYILSVGVADYSRFRMNGRSGLKQQLAPMKLADNKTQLSEMLLTERQNSTTG